MSIAKLHKVTLCGLLSDRKNMLNRLQELGCMHLLPLKPAPDEIENVALPNAGEAEAALEFLAASPDQRKQVLQGEDFSFDEIVAQTLKTKTRLRRLRDRRDFLNERISLVEPWGELAVSADDGQNRHRLWFYELPLRERSALEAIELPWSIIHTDHRFAYVALIATEEPPNDILPVERLHIGSVPLGKLKEQLRETEVDLEDIYAKRHKLTRYRYLLTKQLYRAENAASLKYAEQQCFEDRNIFAVQGWLPADDISSVKAAADDAHLACIFEEAAPGELPPTLLKQPETKAAGVDLALFYQVPGYHTWDPTNLILVSFTLFFAMIMSDAGYGIVMLAALLLFWRKIGSGEKGKAYRRLGLWLTGATIAYGIVVGSYFGVTPPPDSALGTLKFLSPDDFDTMMRISVGAGILHIVIANLMMAYAHRKEAFALSRFGWIFLCVGGYTYWLGFGMPLPQTIGIGTMAAGVLAIFLFTSKIKITKPSDYLLRFVDGTKALGGIMGAFGDVLSYMRLFALGLASASLAITFNDLAGSVYQALPGWGIIVAGLILLIGHTLNFGLALMSGVVHGLRLNFIEFFKWGLDEDGKVFQPFSRKEV